MSEKLSVLAVVPHPDDEAIFMGGTLAKYALEGHDVNLLVLTNGDKGKLAIPNGDKFSFREVSSDERLEFIQERKEECVLSAGTLGIENINFFEILDGEVGFSFLPELKESILRINPHIVFTFNEAGTTSHPDHSWAGILSFYAIKLILSDWALDGFSNKLNILSLMMYVLPNASNLLEKYGEIIDEKNTVSVDVKDSIFLKKRAVDHYKTQAHLAYFFLKIGILDYPQEHFIERIKRNGRSFWIDHMPKDKDVYVSHQKNLFLDIEARCQSISSFSKSL